MEGLFSCASGFVCDSTAFEIDKISLTLAVIPVIAKFIWLIQIEQNIGKLFGAIQINLAATGDLQSMNGQPDF